MSDDLTARLAFQFAEDFSDGSDCYEIADVQDLLESFATAALTAERQAREQAEHERDRLLDALQRVVDCDDESCICCVPCIDVMAAALAQDRR